MLGTRAKIREGHPITIPSSNSEPEPDLAIVRRREEGYLDHHPYPADIYWVIEFSNTSLSKDLEVKSKVYAAAGIVEYWVVHLKQRKLIVFRSPTEAGYESRQMLSEGTIALLAFNLAFNDVQISVQRLLRTGIAHP